MKIKSIQKTTLSSNVIIGLGVIGMSVLAFSYFDISKKWDDMHQNGLLTQAVVTQVQKSVSNKTLKSACCYYTYSVDNQLFSFKICDCYYKMGDSLTVKYNPRKIAEHEVVYNN